MIIALISFYLLASVMGGVALGWIAVHPRRRGISQREVQTVAACLELESVDFKEIRLQSADGATLVGWFLRPGEPSGNAVILLHGIADNRLGMYEYSRWLLKNRYAVLAPDARGHGGSGGLATYGLLEARDIRAWVSWLKDNYHPSCIYGLGESMGAAQLLQALPGEPDFSAVVAVSPFTTLREAVYARLGREFRTGPWLGRTLFRPVVELALLFVRFRYGLDLDKVSPVESIVQTETPVLLIHGTEDRHIPDFHSEAIQRRNAACVALWKVSGAAHNVAYKTMPEEFELRVLEWFTGNTRNRENMT